MDFYTLPLDKTIKHLSSSENYGLTAKEASNRLKKYGQNALSKSKNKSVFSKIIEALKEPMLIILAFGLIITLGSCIG